MIPRTHSDADAARSGPCRGVREVPPPAESGVASWFRAADLVDAFAVPIDAADVTKGVDSLARSALGDPAPWIRLLLGLRDALVAGFGVKTSQEVRRAAIADKADRIDFFRIRARSDRELILGEDDRHLDFRLSLLLRRQAGQLRRRTGCDGRRPLPQRVGPRVSRADSPVPPSRCDQQSQPGLK
jgi:Protein of unknown function (DUF2867)